MPTTLPDPEALTPPETDAARIRQLEAALVEMESDLVEARRAARLGVWHWDMATQTVAWTEEVYRTFELDPAVPPPAYEELEKLHTPESWQRLRACVERAITHGDSYEVDVEIHLPSGRTKWIQASGARDAAGGEPAHLRGTVREITESKVRESLLARSEGRYRSLIRAVSQIVWTTDASGNSITEMPEWEAFTGQTREQYAGNGWADAIHPEDRASTIAAWQQAVATGTNFDVPQQKLRRYDGVYRTMAARAVPSRDAAGNIVEWVGMHVDITARKEAEEGLRQREQRFRDLAESLPQLVWESDPAGLALYRNPRFAEYTGVPDEKMTPRFWHNLVHPEDLASAVTNWQHSLDTGEPYINDYRLLRHDGAYRWFLARAIAVRNSDGTIERWLGTATDIHDQKMAEAALRRSEKLAATGRLAASIAHEINNPLAAVTNSLYLALLDPDLKETTRSYLGLAEQELARVAHVTTQTLRFHQQSSAPVLSDVTDIMDSALSLFAPRFKSNSVKVLRQYEPGRMLNCCAEELRQVFANLLSNALDATRPGGHLVLRIRNVHGGIRITVADTGRGIAPHILRHLYEPFLTTKADTGTGLGLWVTYGIVQKHKGRIAVRSRVGTGTIFSIFFPASSASAA